MAYAKLFSQHIGYVFTDTSIRVTALTGAAAMEIGGRTAASEYNYMSPSSEATTEEIDNFTDTRLNIIDEISFADYNFVLTKISDYLQKVTKCFIPRNGLVCVLTFLGKSQQHPK